MAFFNWLKLKNMEKTIIDLADRTKEAALYFDHVLPMNCNYGDDSVSLSEIGKSIHPPFYEEISGEHLSVMKKAAIWSIHEISLDRLMKYKDFLPQEYLKGEADEWRDIGFEYVDESFGFIQRNNLAKYPLLVEKPLCEVDMEGSVDSEEEFMLSLMNLHLVDAELANWDKILELRRDESSVGKIRKLARFFESDYKGKSRFFIEDDISAKLEDYDNAVRDWEFETKTTCLSMLVQSSSLKAVAATGLAALFLGKPEAAIAVAAGGVSFEAANIHIQMKKRAYGLKKLRRDHPLSYIMDVQELND